MPFIYGKDTGTNKGHKEIYMLAFSYIHIIKYKHSNHFYSEILVQDVNTYIARVNLQTLLPKTWVISNVSKIISVIKEAN
jgi:hypothetical protein